jgi:hypothetical protein
MPKKHGRPKKPTKESSQPQELAPPPTTAHGCSPPDGENRTNRTPTSESRPKWALPFLAHLHMRGSVSAAARAVGVGRRTVYDLRSRDPIFREMMDEHAQSCIENVEATLYQRAVSGESDRMTGFSSGPASVRSTARSGYWPRKSGEIRNEAQRELLQELDARLSQLPEPARDALGAALAQMPQREAARLEPPKP